MASSRDWVRFFNGSETELFSVKKSEIIESHDLNDIRKYIKPGMWLILDLDNTVFEPEDKHQEMGGDQWFVSLLNYASKVPLAAGDPNHIALVLAIYHAVQHFVELKLVQPEVVGIIKTYQDAGWTVMALTARGPEIMEPTFRELKKLGIDFTGAWGKGEFLMDVDDSYHPPVFKKGIFFCGGKPKDRCLQALLDFCKQTPDMLMADDKVKYLQAVSEMVKNSYNGTVIGLHYRRLDEKVKNHDFDAAQRELRAIQDLLPEDAQEAMRKLKI